MDITKEFLDMTYPDKYYKNVIQPAKMGTGPVPSKLQMLGKSQPIKALTMQLQNLFSPGKYDVARAAGTKAGSQFLGSNLTYGIPFAYASGASALQKSLEKQGLTGKGGIYDVSGGWGAMGAGADVEYDIDDEETDGWTTNFPDSLLTGQNIYRPDIRKLMQNQQFKQTQLMNRRKQDMQQKIRQAEAVQQVQQNIQTYGNRDRPNEGINTPGGGKGQSPTGGDVAGTPFVRGGRASYFDGGLLSLWPR